MTTQSPCGCALCSHSTKALHPFAFVSSNGNSSPNKAGMVKVKVVIKVCVMVKDNTRTLKCLASSLCDSRVCINKFTHNLSATNTAFLLERSKTFRAQASQSFKTLLASRSSVLRVLS